ncbi:MAG: hypothetical protein KBT34_00965 [Prevotella sp.]|nr:hypothetical protein [Candidatus Prevotella equi]
MNEIILIDNTITQAPEYARKEVAALFPFADKSLSKLCEENENLLIFPHSIEKSDDRIADSSLFNLVNTEDSEKVRIVTGNIMGFIGIGNLQIKIKSRFDKGRDNYFLHYMLQKVMSFNFFDLNHNNEREDVFDFMMFMFPYYLKTALRQGIYREYRTFKHNDANVRGTLNFNKHISHNIPFVGNIAYSTREYCHDNSVTELIRHTIEFMRTKRYGEAVLNIDRETMDNVKCIMEHTQSYAKSERNYVISKNLRHKTHPYYTEYKPLILLCIQILRMEEVKFGETDDEICGILFDGAWLWEEYVNTILNQLGYTHPENKLKKEGIYLFSDIADDGKIHRSGVRYPDFYKEDIVLDAKYKRLGDYDKVSKVSRDDIHQVITYMTNLKASKGGFIAPLENKQVKVPTSHLKDSVAQLSIYGIEISKNTNSYSEFCLQMKENEDCFLQLLST